MIEVRIIEPQKEEIRKVEVDDIEMQQLVNNHLCENGILIPKQITDKNKFIDKYDKVQIDNDTFLNIKIEIRTEGF